MHLEALRCWNHVKFYAAISFFLNSAFARWTIKRTQHWREQNTGAYLICGFMNWEHEVQSSAAMNFNCHLVVIFTWYSLIPQTFSQSKLKIFWMKNVQLLIINQDVFQRSKNKSVGEREGNSDKPIADIFLISYPRTFSKSFCNLPWIY